MLFIVFFAIYVAGYEKEGEFDQIGRSEFYATPQGKIYALIPSGGKFELKGVQADKFRVLNSAGNRGGNVGTDENAVYCGNQAMAGLNPARVKSVGNGYFTDGEVSYFCGGAGKPNDEISDFALAMGTTLHAFFGADKPQSYVYKIRRVKSVNLSPILGFGFAAESGAKKGENIGKSSPNSAEKLDDAAFFEGEELDGADAAALRYVKDASGRDSDFYVTDGRNVYFKDLRLGVKFTPQLREAAYFGGVHYLLEPASGVVYANEHEFAPEFAPYSLPFGASSAYAYHLFFRDKDRIYFWQKELGERAKPGRLE